MVMAKWQRSNGKVARLMTSSLSYSTRHVVGTWVMMGPKTLYHTGLSSTIKEYHSLLEPMGIYLSPEYRDPLVFPTQYMQWCFTLF